MSYKDGSYWHKRRDLIYYRYLELFIRCIGPNSSSLIDVGTGNAPYLEWFDWIPEKFSIDIRVPYQSDSVQGIHGNILDVDFERRFDIVTCLQVLEHVEDPYAFSKRLLEMGDEILVSVPYQWPAGKTKGHIHDPVDLDKIVDWFGREPNYHLMVQEPFRRQKGKGRRLFCVFNTLDPGMNYQNSEIWKNRKPIPDSRYPGYKSS